MSYDSYFLVVITVCYNIYIQCIPQSAYYKLSWHTKELLCHGNTNIISKYQIKKITLDPQCHRLEVKSIRRHKSRFKSDTSWLLFFFMFCASLRSANHVKMQQEVSDLNRDYVTICLRQNNCGWSNHHQSISKFFSITQFTQNRGIHIKLSTTVIYYIPIRYIKHAGIVIKDHLN